MVGSVLLRRAIALNLSVAVVATSLLVFVKVSGVLESAAAEPLDYQALVVSDGPSLYFPLDDVSPTDLVAESLVGPETIEFDDVAAAVAGPYGGDTAVSLSASYGVFKDEFGADMSPTGETVEFWFAIDDAGPGSEALLNGLAVYWDPVEGVGGLNPFGCCSGAQLFDGELLISGSTSGCDWNLASGAALDDGDFHHVVATDLGFGRHRLYVDSVLVNEDFEACPTASRSRPHQRQAGIEDWITGSWSGIGLGWQQSGPLCCLAGDLTGVIDEIAYYDYPLSARAVALHYRESGREAQATVPARRSARPASLSEGLVRSPQRFRSDPVNAATGAYSETRVDAVVAGAGADFALTRSYVSDTDDTGSGSGDLGPGWSLNVAASVAVAGSLAQVTLESGQVIEFERQPTGSGGEVWDPEPGVIACLEDVPSANGWLDLIATDGTRWGFDPVGRLVSKVDSSGEGFAVTYTGPNSNDEIDTIALPGGQTVTFADGPSGQLESVDLPGGRFVHYAYTPEGLLSRVETSDARPARYEYDEDDRLTKAIRVTAGTDPITEDPIEVVEVENEYDSGTGRVVRQWDPLRNESTFAWDPETESSTMTDASGAQWIDLHVNGVMVGSEEPVGPGGALVASGIAVDGFSNPTSITDANANEWLAAYDDLGNLVERRHPAPVDDEFRDLELRRPGESDAANRVHECAGVLDDLRLRRAGPHPFGDADRRRH